jgi:hypothetical protein
MFGVSSQHLAKLGFHVSSVANRQIIELLRYYNFLGYVVTGPTHLEIIDEAHVLLSSQTHFKEVADIT